MLKKICFCAVVLLNCINLYGQRIDLDQLSGMSMRNIGPAGMSGRVTAIDVDLSYNVIYVGTASGGVWKSDNGGVSWVPIFDEQPTQAIGAVKVNQKNPSEIWVGTGEGNPRNSHNSGAGIFRTLDGGKTWKFMGLRETKLIHRILIDQHNPSTVYVGALGSAWGPNKERGVYKSTDAGLTWKQILYVDENTGVGELIMDPTNPNKLLCNMWEYRRKPWTFNSGGKSSGLHLSFDGGQTWKKLTEKDGLPVGDLGRMGLAISPANPKVAYALIEATENAVYKSTDGALTWKKISTDANMGNRPFYYAEIYADTKNENKIFSLWSYLSMSDDGGKSFRVIADYGNAVHPDHHALWIHPQNPNYILDGNDGGLNVSYDGGNSWQFILNLPVGQFYHVNVDNDFPYNVYGGMQDNGSWIGPSFVLRQGGIRNSDWQEVYFGDGFDVAPIPNDLNYGYAMSQGGALGIFDRLTGRTEFIKPVRPDSTDLRFNWNAALAVDPFNSDGIYYGSQYVHYSNDRGRNWLTISPDLTTNDTSKQKQDKSGGLTIDATGAENHTTILVIAPSKVDRKVIWVGTDDGNIQITKDGGKTWTNVAKQIKDFPKHAWINQMHVSSKNAGEIFVAVNNYRQNDWSAYAYHTQDYGMTWKRIVNDQQVGGFINAIVQDPEVADLLFLGTDVGLYISFDKGVNWNHWKKKFPQVQIYDLAIQEQFADLVIGSFGRAFWVLDDIRPLREIAKTKGACLQKDYYLMPSAPAYLTSNKSYQGVRFNAQGDFIGENKSTNANITLWRKNLKHNVDTNSVNAKKSDKPKEDEKLKIWIVGDLGDTLRAISRELKDTGIITIRWSLQEDGVRFPNRNEPKNDQDLPGGKQLLPGKYKVIVQYKSFKDSTTLEVNQDPRITLNMAQEQEKRKQISEFEKLVERATKAYNQIKECKKSFDLVEKIMINLPDSSKNQIKDLHKTQRKSLSKIEQQFMSLEENPKGLIRFEDHILSALFGASGYLNGSWNAPGGNALRSKEIAVQKVQQAIRDLNNYISKDWLDYQSKIKQYTFNPLKEVKAIDN